MKISIVIPVFREEGIAALLDDLLNRQDGKEIEIIIVDGAPEHDTLDRITDHQVADLRVTDLRVTTPRIIGLTSPLGRGAQQNRGAEAASGDILLFLHADTLLPVQAFTLIRQTLANPAFAGGAFSLGYAPATPGLSFIAAAANLRSRWTRVPYGDQAIFVRCSVFRELGGFSPLPVMEDLEFMTRLRRHGLRISILAMSVRTSARRHLREGILRCTLRNLLLRLLYHCGVRPSLLAALYRRHGV
jgi:rSAM/selenodomain-associated transferase 2